MVAEAIVDLPPLTVGMLSDYHRSTYLQPGAILSSSPFLNLRCRASFIAAIRGNRDGGDLIPEKWSTHNVSFLAN
jgi:hypothetical protein